MVVVDILETGRCLCDAAVGPCLEIVPRVTFLNFRGTSEYFKEI